MTVQTNQIPNPHAHGTRPVENTVKTLSVYQHDNVGQPKENPDPNVWFFRGHKDTRFAFTSTLYRRLLDASSDKLPNRRPKEHENLMLEAERNLLSKARNMGIGRGLTALETLTLLQHHGSPTRLIDITSDWKVALFFACESDHDRDGQLFLIKIDTSRWINFPKDQNATERTDRPVWQDYGKKFRNRGHWRNEWISGTWPILLPFSDPRMISQRGYFLVGGVPSLQGASNLYTSKCEHCKKKCCGCSRHTVLPRNDTEQRTPIDSPLTVQELRNITSMAIRFGADRTFFDEVAEAKCNDWSAVGYSIRVRKEHKRTLREILREKGVHTDSIYPPLRETVRLFEYVVDESFKTEG